VEDVQTCDLMDSGAVAKNIPCGGTFRNVYTLRPEKKRRRQKVNSSQDVVTLFVRNQLTPRIISVGF
jgi:hypothetical protein